MGDLKLMCLLQPKQDFVNDVSHFFDRLVVCHIKPVLPGQPKYIILTVSIAGKGLKSIRSVIQPLNQKANLSPLSRRWATSSNMTSRGSGR